jgi:hypothetical protein
LPLLWRRLRQAGRRELRAGEIRSSHGELGRRSARRVRAGSATDELRPGCSELGNLRQAEMSADDRDGHEMSASGGRPGRSP